MLVSGRVVQKSLRQGLFKMVEESTNLNAHSPDKIKHSQDKIKHSPDKIKHSSDKIKHSPDKIKHSPDKIKHSPDKIKHSPDKIKHSPEKLNYFLHFSATVIFSCPARSLFSARARGTAVSNECDILRPNLFLLSTSNLDLFKGIPA